jgi:uncharacterized protein YjbI with pentapeptide repeats
MADRKLLKLLTEDGGVTGWNMRVTYEPEERRDLSRANLAGMELDGIAFLDTNLRKANLRGADLANCMLTSSDLRGADLKNASLVRGEIVNVDFSGADLRGAKLASANCEESNLSGADLRGADLRWTNLTRVTLRKARLEGARLENAHFVQTDFSGADLTGCTVYGVSAWELNLSNTRQHNLVITREDEPSLTVDNLELAQFIYLLLRNQKIREVIQTLTSKVVLILGRFTRSRKRVLDAIRETVRHAGYVPILFDFEPSRNRDLTETIQTLASMAALVIADLTDAKSVPQELSAIIPLLPSVPVQPLISGAQKEYALFEHWKRYAWVLPIYRYRTTRDLLGHIEKSMVGVSRKLEKAR